MSFWRYYVRKQSGMTRTCLFPTGVSPLFDGLIVKRTMGVKLPFSGLMSRLVGQRIVTAVNLFVGRLPGVKWLCYCVMVEAEKPGTATGVA
jgi:hypothetical protein